MADMKEFMRSAVRTPGAMASIIQGLDDANDAGLRDFMKGLGKMFYISRRETSPRLNAFQKAAIDLGIIEKLVRIMRRNLSASNSSSRTFQDAGITAYHAAEALTFLIQCGNVDDRSDVLEDFVDCGLVDVCLDQILNHPLSSQRLVSMNLLRVLAAESFLGSKLTPEKQSKVILAACEYTLRGPDFFVQQMSKPEMIWQNALIFDDASASAEKIARYAPRRYAMSQENAMWTIQGLLCRIPPSTPEFLFDILKTEPKVLDQLFACAMQPSPPWYPETQVDSIACEILAAFFQIPYEIVMGVPETFRLPEEMEKKNKEGMEKLICSVRLLVGRENWVDKIMASWNKLEEEKWRDVKKLLSRVANDYHAQIPPGEQDFLNIFEYRGTSRASILTLIITIATLSTQCSIPTNDLIALLPIAHAASQPLKKAGPREPLDEQYARMEAEYEIFRIPLWAGFTQTDVPATAKTAPMLVLGPTAYFSLLTAIGRSLPSSDDVKPSLRLKLKEVWKWKHLPKGMPALVKLGMVKQAMGEEAMRNTAVLALTRAKERREKGNERFKNKKEDTVEHAEFAYVSVARLAAAMTEFEAVMALDSPGVGGKIVEGAVKELVFGLGNAAEMAILDGCFERGLSYALGAVEVAKAGILKQVDGLDASSVEKNERRAERATDGIAKRVPGGDPNKMSKILARRILGKRGEKNEKIPF